MTIDEKKLANVRAIEREDAQVKSDLRYLVETWPSPAEFAESLARYHPGFAREVRNALMITDILRKVET